MPTQNPFSHLVLSVIHPQAQHVCAAESRRHEADVCHDASENKLGGAIAAPKEVHKQDRGGHPKLPNTTRSKQLYAAKHVWGDCENGGVGSKSWAIRQLGHLTRQSGGPACIRSHVPKIFPSTEGIPKWKRCPFDFPSKPTKRRSKPQAELRKTLEGPILLPKLPPKQTSGNHALFCTGYGKPTSSTIDRRLPSSVSTMPGVAAKQKRPPRAGGARCRVIRRGAKDGIGPPSPPPPPRKQKKTKRCSVLLGSHPKKGYTPPLNITLKAVSCRFGKGWRSLLGSKRKPTNLRDSILRNTLIRYVSSI